MYGRLHVWKVMCMEGYPYERLSIGRPMRLVGIKGVLSYMFGPLVIEYTTEFVGSHSMAPGGPGAAVRDI